MLLERGLLTSRPMKPSLRRPLAVSLAFAAFASLAQAHPGHDGHELTWDFQHLAAHPLATLGCLAVLGAAAWGIRRLARHYSLRGSQASRRK